MNDLISKQAVIDAIEKNAYRHTYLDQITDIIKRMPSAQPEIIRCKDCKWWEDDSYTLFQVIMRDDNHHHCISFDAYTKADDYCSFAGRREDVDKETGCD